MIRWLSPRPASIRSRLSASASTTFCSASRRERPSAASATTIVCSACLRARASSASPWFSAIWACTRALVSAVCMSACAWAAFKSCSFFGRRLPALVGFELLGRQLPLTQLLEQRFDLVVAFDVVGLPISTSTHSMSNSRNFRCSSSRASC